MDEKRVKFEPDHDLMNDVEELSRDDFDETRETSAMPKRHLGSKEKLAKIGSKLDVTEEDISNIKRQYRLVKILCSIVGGMAVFLSAVLGYLTGKEEPIKVSIIHGGGGYPYATTALFILGASLTASRKSIIRKRNLVLLVFTLLTFICSILAYAVAYDVAQPVEYYHLGIEYGVYSKE